jgi:hypothetical protein
MKLGYGALIERFELQVPPPRQMFTMGAKPVNTIVQAPDGSERVEMRKGTMEDGASIRNHLTFALKREDLNLTVLGALFEREEVLAEVNEWLAQAPTSQYARQCGFLVEWLTETKIDFKAPPGIRRLPVLDKEKYITARGKPVSKWGVVDNLLGTRTFSPLVRRTPLLERLLAERLHDKVREAVGSIEPEILQRAVDYLYLSETRSTYGIEQEVPDNNRSARFRVLLETAGEPGLLDEDRFVQWQNRIVSELAKELSYRQEQNWLSRPGRRSIADFIPPAPDLVPDMMDGLDGVAQLAASNDQIDPVIVAACAAFGFVFIHPFLDGNGRLHRFLIHHLLRLSGFTPPTVVLPVSARMLHRLDRYSQLLKAYSRPRTDLVNYQLDAESATIRVTSPQPLWLYAYFDATECCEFLLECVKESVEVDLAAEVAYLRAHDAAVGELEEWLDLPQARMNTLISTIVNNGGKLTAGKRKLVAHLSDDAVGRIEEAVRRHFAAIMGVQHNLSTAADTRFS